VAAGYRRPVELSRRTRRIAARVLVVAASVVILLALLAGYVERAAIDSDQFANRATAALRDDSVRSLIATELTDRVVLKDQSDLLAARPIIQSAAAGIVGGAAFTRLFRAAVRDVHAALFNREQSTVALTVADVGTVLGAALEKLRPSLARQVRATGDVTVVKRNVGEIGAKAAGVADRIRALALLLLALALLLVAAALAISPDRRRTIVGLGVGAAAAGALLVVAYDVARSVALNHVEGAEARAAAGAIWDAFLSDLRGAAWILAGSGAVVAAAAASYIRPLDIREPLWRVGRWVAAEPRHPALRALRAIALLALGIVVVVEPDAVVRLVVTVLGVFLIYAGVTALLRLVYRPRVADERAVRPEAPATRRSRRLAAPLMAGGLIVAAVAAFLGTGGATTAAPPTNACNGHSELCNRSLDQVALAATHNAMSVPLPGWYAAEQDHPIARQLSDGVRGLLIDTHYADKLGNGRLRTDFVSGSKPAQVAQADGVSPSAVAAAKRIRDRLGFAGKGRRGMYLCHTFCELGGTRLDSVLHDLHDFLVANPDEVVVVINEDYVTPEDFVGAVKSAGLEGLVYRGPVGRSWPTLRQMIDSDQRVVFLAENHAGAAPWYHLAFKSITEETPYAFSKVPQLTDAAELAVSCRPGRGPRRAPLFLVNHWISTDPVPLPSNAAKVNAYDELLARVRECQRVRDHFPNLIAVNFYSRGGLFRVVDALNGVR
jgi:hypothetical protein